MGGLLVHHMFCALQGTVKCHSFFFFFFFNTLLFHNFLNFNISSVICFLLTGVTTLCVSQGVYGFILMSFFFDVFVCKIFGHSVHLMKEILKVCIVFMVYLFVY